MLTVTDVVEYTFCKRFPYYTLVLGIPQHEERRGTVQSGREYHRTHESYNTTYVPTAYYGKKFVSITLYSKNLNLIGKIDEAVFEEDRIVLIERKYSDFCYISDTIKVQLGLLSLLLEEEFKKIVNSGIVIFSKTKRVEIEVLIDDFIKNFAIEKLKGVERVVKAGIDPDETPDGRCLNCCFRNICPVGSLYIP